MSEKREEGTRAHSPEPQQALGTTELVPSRRLVAAGKPDQVASNIAPIALVQIIRVIHFSHRLTPKKAYGSVL